MSGFVTVLAVDKATGGDLVGDLTGANAIGDAARQSAAGSREARELTAAATAQAREDINRIFPQAQQSARQGFQGALDIFGQSLPAQTDVFQQGNVGAQQAILSGLPQIQNALLGGNVDFNQLQPFQVQQPDLGFFQQQLPETPQQQAMDEAERQRVLSNSSIQGAAQAQNFFRPEVTPEQRASAMARLNELHPNRVQQPVNPLTDFQKAMNLGGFGF